MVGPMDFTTNDECGVLVEGFDRLPTILNPWTPPVGYRALLEGYGLTKAMDLLMWQLYIDDREKVHPAIWEAAEKVSSEHGITVRSMRKRDLQAEVTRFLEVYNAAWERNWGFVPLTEEEVRVYAKDLKPVLDENWAFIAEKADGEVVGAALTLPDYNQVLKRTPTAGCFPSGGPRRCTTGARSTPCGSSRSASSRSTSTPASRRASTSCTSTRPSARRRRAARWAGSSRPTRAMNRAMEGMGGHVVSRYRVYEKTLP